MIERKKDGRSVRKRKIYKHNIREKQEMKKEKKKMARPSHIHAQPSFKPFPFIYQKESIKSFFFLLQVTVFVRWLERHILVRKNHDKITTKKSLQSNENFHFFEQRGRAGCHWFSTG